MIYWITFFFSCLFFYYADKIKGSASKLLTLMGLILPILLAALRSENVGIDVRVYVKPLYDEALRSQNISQFMLYKAARASIAETEIGYSFLAYFSTKITNKIWGILVASEMFVIIPIYFTIKEYNVFEKNIPVWMGMLCYYGIFYNNSLNQIRQSIAVALCMYAFMLIVHEKWKKSILIIFFATTIHSSAPFIIVVYSIYYLIKKKKNFLLYLITIFIAAFWLFSNKIFIIIVKIFTPFFNILNAKYVGQLNAYISHGYNNNDMNFSWMGLSLLMICISWLIWRKEKKSPINLFFLYSSIIFFCMLPFSARYDTFGRLTWYFMCWVIIILPSLRNNVIRYNKTTRIIANIFNFIIIIMYWIVVYGLFDFTGTMPYKFFWQ